MPKLISEESFLARAMKLPNFSELQNEMGSALPQQEIFRVIAERALDSDFREAFYSIPFPTIPGTGIGFASDHPDISYTVRAGLANIRVIDRFWRRHRKPKGKYRVLEFGCGSGRLLRFPCEFGEGIEVIGCEVNPKAVDWLNQNFPCDIHLMTKKHDVSFVSGKLDLIYAWSIFTHFSESEQKMWLKALVEKLNPGGLLIATFKSTDMLERLETDESYRRLSRADSVDMVDLKLQAKSGFVFYECYDASASSDHGVDASSFGQAYISHDYIRSAWSDFGEVADIDVAVPSWQDIVVLRKR